MRKLFSKLKAIITALINVLHYGWNPRFCRQSDWVTKEVVSYTAVVLSRKALAKLSDRLLEVL